MKIAAVGDIHLGENDKGKWKEYFRHVSKNADVLLLCGDLTDNGYAKEAEILKDELQACSIPVIGVLGNHDFDKGEQDHIKQILTSENVHLLDGDSLVIGDVGFAGVKGFGGGFDKYMLAKFGENMIKDFVEEAVNEALKLDNALMRLESKDQLKKIAIMHFSPLKSTVIGEPEQVFPFLGSSRLAEPLNQRQVAAAFHGHAHLGTLKGETSRGIPIFNVSKAILEKSGIKPAYFIYDV